MFCAHAYQHCHTPDQRCACRAVTLGENEAAAATRYCNRWCDRLTFLFVAVYLPDRLNIVAVVIDRCGDAAYSQCVDDGLQRAVLAGAGGCYCDDNLRLGDDRALWKAGVRPKPDRDVILRLATAEH